MAASLESVVLDPADHISLQEQSRFVLLGDPVRDLLSTAKANAAALKSLTVIHISSTASGGGVAEMLRALGPIYGELGLRSEWLVLHPPAALAASFFSTTKTLHNLIHGAPVDASGLDAPLYVRVSNLGAAAFISSHGGPALSDTVFICHESVPPSLIASHPLRTNTLTPNSTWTPTNKQPSNRGAWRRTQVRLPGCARRVALPHRFCRGQRGRLARGHRMGLPGALSRAL